MKKVIILVLFFCTALFSCSQRPPSEDALSSYRISSEQITEDRPVKSSNSLVSAETRAFSNGELRTLAKGNTTILYPYYGEEFCDGVILESIDTYTSSKEHQTPVLYDFFVSEGEHGYSIVFYDSSSASSSKNNLFSVTFSKDKTKQLVLSDFIHVDSPVEHIETTLKLLYGVDGVFDSKRLPEFYVNEIGLVVIDRIGTRYMIPRDYFVQKPNRRVTVGSDYEPVTDLSEKVVALTFDDGPHWTVTRSVLDMLREKDAKATFFVIGCNIAGNEYLLRRMVDQGCDVGIHSFYHKNYYTMSYDAIMKDINDCAELIYDATDMMPYLVRPPFGNMPEYVISEKEYFYINWCVDPYDWNSSSAEEIKNHVLTHVKPGSIVLMHDIYNVSYEAASQIIDELKADGWRFVTVSELFDLKDKEPSGKTYYGLGY